MKPQPHRNRSSTFAKGLAVLRCFGPDDVALKSSEIARRCDLDRAVARRLLLTLLDQGYVAQEDDRFSLTAKVVGLAGAFLQGRRFGTLVQPILEECVEQVGATVTLATLDDDHALYVAQASATPTRVTFGFTLGSRLPLQCTAIGRAVLAALPAERADAIIDALRPESFTPQTGDDAEVLKAAVSDARRSGRACVGGVFETGVVGLAAVVPTRNGPPYALGASFLESEATDARKDRVFERLHNCARILARVL